jgi:hypothetical protein
VDLSSDREETYMPRTAYQIRVAGEVPLAVLENFEGVRSLTTSTSTLLQADLADPAALHGLLSALRREGLELLDVRRELPAEAPDPTEPPGTG